MSEKAKEAWKSFGLTVGKSVLTALIVLLGQVFGGTL